MNHLNHSFYENCIINDRNTRRFQDFSNEQWFKEFLKLADEDFIVNSHFEHLGVSSRARELFDLNDVWRRLLESTAMDLELEHLQSIWEQTFPNLMDVSNYIESLSLSKECLDLLISINPYLVAGFMYTYKHRQRGNIFRLEEKDQALLVKINMPIIRIMEHFLERNAFRVLAYTMQTLEYEYVVLWLNTHDELKTIIKQNIHNPDVFYFFSQLRNEEFTQFFESEYLCVFENATVEAICMALMNASIEDYLNQEFFLNAFARYTLKEQIKLLDLIESKECTSEFSSKLHKLLNKKVVCKNSTEFLYSTFQMSYDRAKRMLYEIEKSSYFAKSDIKSSHTWQSIMSGWQNVQSFNPNVKGVDYYSEIMKLYWQCRKYATSSIVGSLYPLNTCSGPVTHIQNESFNILARVRTLWECKELADTFKARTFCSFSILTEKNMSHYGDDVLYGYYTNVSDELIAHISPFDSLSQAGAKFECDLTKQYNLLLDIEDLNQSTLQQRTYNQLCIRTKCENGEILWPDCIICIDSVDAKSKMMAEKLGLKIIVLHKNEDTIEKNEDIYKYLP